MVSPIPCMGPTVGRINLLALHWCASKGWEVRGFGHAPAAPLCPQSALPPLHLPLYPCTWAMNGNLCVVVGWPRPCAGPHLAGCPTRWQTRLDRGFGGSGRGGGRKTAPPTPAPHSGDHAGPTRSQFGHLAEKLWPFQCGGVGGRRGRRPAALPCRRLWRLVRRGRGACPWGSPELQWG